MQLFKTTASAEGCEPQVSFQGSQTEAAQARKALKVLGDGVVFTQQTIEVPTGKSGLLKWLNTNVKACRG